MKIIDVIIVVDTAAVLASGSANTNAYFIDSNGFLGSWSEGTAELTTVCQDGNTIQWTAVAVSNSGDVSIAGFGGSMVQQSVCNPVLIQSDGEPWEGRVESHGQFALFTYTINLSISGQPFSLTAAIKIA